MADLWVVFELEAKQIKTAAFAGLLLGCHFRFLKKKTKTTKTSKTSQRPEVSIATYSCILKGVLGRIGFVFTEDGIHYDALALAKEKSSSESEDKTIFPTGASCIACCLLCLFGCFGWLVACFVG